MLTTTCFTSHHPAPTGENHDSPTHTGMCTLRHPDELSRLSARGWGMGEATRLLPCVHTAGRGQAALEAPDLRQLWPSHLEASEEKLLVIAVSFGSELGDPDTCLPSQNSSVKKNVILLHCHLGCIEDCAHGRCFCRWHRKVSHWLFVALAGTGWLRSPHLAFTPFLGSAETPNHP